MVSLIMSALNDLLIPQVRVVVLTANGKFFCTGMDLGASNQKNMQQELQSGKENEGLKLWETLRKFPKPIIARINGPAMGGGWGLLFTTDIRIAVQDAWFSFSEVKRGVVPAIISAYVVPEFGTFRAKQLFLTGEKVSASQAMEYGFLSQVVADEESLDIATKKYIDILLESGPKAMEIIKEAVYHVNNHSHQENLTYVNSIFQKHVITSEEARYGIMCFMNRQKPNWTQFYLDKAKL